MLQVWVIVLASFLYLGVLFGIAWYADHRADHGRSLIANKTSIRGRAERVTKTSSAIPRNP